MIPHNRPTFGDEEVRAVADVVRSGHWVAGKKCALLETKLGHHFSFQSAVTTASGSASLRLAMHVLGVGLGDEVVVPAYSCVALANATLALGAQPVPVDVLDGDWNIDPEKAVRALTRKTRAIIAVNTFGLPARIRDLGHLGVPIIEDMAHGFALADDKQPLASPADMVLTSFYATKLMGAGQGGAILTRDLTTAAKLKDWRDYTDKEADGGRFNDQMTDIEAALALCQLERLPSMVAARQRIAVVYDARLAKLEADGILKRPKIQSRIWYRYVIEPLQMSSAHLTERLRARGVGAARPVELWSSTHTPVAVKAFDRLVSLPIYPTLSTEDAHSVCNSLIASFEAA